MAEDPRGSETALMKLVTALNPVSPRKSRVAAPTRHGSRAAASLSSLPFTPDDCGARCAPGFGGLRLDATAGRRTVSPRVVNRRDTAPVAGRLVHCLDYRRRDRRVKAIRAAATFAISDKG